MKNISFQQWLKNEGYVLWYRQEPLYLRNAEDYSTETLLKLYMESVFISTEHNLQMLVKNKSLDSSYANGYKEGFAEAIKILTTNAHQT